MSIAAYFILYSLAIIAASLLGGWVPIVIRLTHRRLQIATSLIAGFMLGVALLYLLPHALLALDAHAAVLWVLAGLLTMFFLERFFSYHHHTAPAEGDLPPITADPEPVEPCDQEPGLAIDHHHGHIHAHDPLHVHPHDHAHDHGHGPAHKLSWTGVGLGLALHSMIDGAALAAVMKAEAQELGSPLLPGLAVFIGVILHKPFDSMTLLTMLKTSHWPPSVQHLVNGLFSLIAPLGGVLFFLGMQGLDAHNAAVGAAVAFAAGVFLCVALADLLPEVQFHQHDRSLLSAAVVLGLALAWGIAHFEATSHAHEEGHGLTTEHTEHAGRAHDHAHEHE